MASSIIRGRTAQRWVCAAVLLSVFASACQRSKPAPPSSTSDTATSARDAAQEKRDRLLTALITVEYMAERPGAAATAVAPTRMSFQQAFAIIRDDTTYGKENRRFRANQVCHLLQSGSSSCEAIDPIPQNCVPAVSGCMLKKAVPGDDEAAIRFTTEPDMILADAVGVLDPQNWDEIVDTSFPVITRTGATGASCPAVTNGPPSTTMPDTGVGSSWDGPVYENYVHCSPGGASCTRLHTSLCFDLDVSAPTKEFRSVYRLCSPSSYGGNIIGGKPPVDEVLDEDSGYCYVREAPAGTANVTCVKRLALLPAACDGGVCQVTDLAFLHAGLRVLASETGIALHDEAGTVPNQACDFNCEIGADEDFCLPSTSFGSPNLCGMTQSTCS